MLIQGEDKIVQTVRGISDYSNYSEVESNKKGAI